MSKATSTSFLVADGLRPVVEAALGRRDQEWWEQVNAICGRVANGFEAADPNFDRVEFLTQCGLV